MITQATTHATFAVPAIPTLPGADEISSPLGIALTTYQAPTLAHFFKSIVAANTPLSNINIFEIAEAIRQNPFKVLDMFQGQSMAEQALAMGTFLVQHNILTTSEAFNLTFDTTTEGNLTLRHGGTFMLGSLCNGIALMVEAEAVLV